MVTAQLRYRLPMLAWTSKMKGCSTCIVQLEKLMPGKWMDLLRAMGSVPNPPGALGLFGFTNSSFIRTSVAPCQRGIIRHCTNEKSERS